MSYILEALKKAQAERQLGTSPTLHAPTLHAADQAEAGGRLKKPLVLAVLAMGAVIAVLLAMVLRPASQPQAVTQPAALTSATTAPAAVVAAQAPPVPTAAQAPAPVRASLPEPAPLPAPVAALPPPVATLSPAAAPTPAPISAKPAAAQEDPVVNLRDLPEPIQRSIPQITVGGYIYSKNAADRVLLIDKVLRHEGEEVSPGLILEKLQPKEAVFSFKGYRYRVPY